MSEIVERCAKQLLAKSTNPFVQGVSWDILNDSIKQKYRDYVRIVLNGLREPSEEMVDAAAGLPACCTDSGEGYVDTRIAREVWQLMVDDALAD